MKHARISTAIVAFALAIGMSGAAMAGPYSDDLGKCMVSSTTSADKGTLVKWVFATTALHPEVGTISSITDDQRAELTKSTAELFMSLLTERCKTQAQEAMKYEGTETIQTSFGVLGRAAMRELFSSPEVMKGLGALAQHFDKDRFEKAFGKAN